MKLIRNKYFSILLWGITSFVGLFVYDWELVNLLFFVYLTHLIKSPFVIFTYHVMNKKDSGKTITFLPIFLFVFAFFSTFFMFLFHALTPKWKRAMGADSFYGEFDNLMNEYLLAVAVLVIFEIVKFLVSRNKIIEHPKSAKSYAITITIYYALMFLVVLMAAVLNSNEFDFTSLQIGGITIILFVLADLIYARKSKPIMKE